MPAGAVRLIGERWHGALPEVAEVGSPDDLDFLAIALLLGMMTMDRIADQAQRITSPVVAQPAHRDFAPPLILSDRFAICREARMVRDGEPCGPNVYLQFCF